MEPVTVTVTVTPTQNYANYLSGSYFSPFYEKTHSGYEGGSRQNTYRRINITEDDYCYMDLAYDSFFNNFIETNEYTNIKNKNQESHMVLLKKNFESYEQNYSPECLKHLSVSSFFVYSNLGFNSTSQCLINTREITDDCLCNGRNRSLQINESLDCLCSLSIFEGYNSDSITNHTGYFFRRRCVIVSKISDTYTDDWISTCSFQNTPFPFEKLYFNTSNTEETSTVSTVKDKITDSTTKLRIPRSVNSISYSDESIITTTPNNTIPTKFKESPTTKTTMLSSAFQSTISQSITTNNHTSDQMTRDKSTSRSSTLPTKDSTTVSKITTDYISTLPFSSVTKDVSTIPSRSFMLNVSTSHTSQIPKENITNLSESIITTSIPIETTLLTTQSLEVLTVGEQGKLQGLANPLNNPFVKNPFLSVLFLLFHILLYCGFFRKEYLSIKKSSL